MRLFSSSAKNSNEFTPIWNQLAQKYEDNDYIINVSDPGLTVCPAGPSCCSRQVEARLASWSRNTFMDQLFNTTTSMAAELDAKATQVDGE